MDHPLVSVCGCDPRFGTILLSDKISRSNAPRVSVIRLTTVSPSLRFTLPPRTRSHLVPLTSLYPQTTMAVDVFSVPVFLVVFREALETVIIISILFAFLKQTLDGPERNVKVYKKLVAQVWLGTGLGLLLCLIIGGALIGVFYTIGANKWDTTELNYEGAFALVASVIISVVGIALLRVGKMQEKWRVKLAAAIEGPVQTRGRRGALKRFFEKYFMFMLPFVTVLREGIEAIVFVAGVTFSAPATSVPLPAVVGLLVGGLVGYLLYKYTRWILPH